ncbi:MAG: AAA family ATPase [Clostridiales bacterium]|nr:AAA family ATPase [Clostridiales bacterium]
MNKTEEMYFDKLSAKSREAAAVFDLRRYKGMLYSIIEKYSDKAHFIYELLQNADDAKATYARFELDNSQLVFAHNGKRRFSISDPDTEDEDYASGKIGDINAITSIGGSNKSSDASIGKFGLGFKSVFQYTSTPFIYDPNFFFKIEKIIVPVRLESDNPLRKRDETLFVFPFNEPQRNNKESFEDIAARLKSLEYPLLFLSNLQNITFTILSSKESYALTVDESKSFGNTHAELLTLTRSWDTDQSSDTLWRFTRSDASNLKHSVGFFLDKDGLLKPKVHCAFCFFPTKVVTGLNFIINAPFLLTDSREGIKAGDPHNKRMIESLSALAADSLVYLRSIGEKSNKRLINDNIFKIVPFDESRFGNINSISSISFRPFYTSIKEAFMTKILIPSSIGYVSSQDAYWAYPSVANLFSTKQLVKISGNANANWVFVSIQPTKERLLTDYIRSIITMTIDDSVLLGEKPATNKNFLGITPSFIESQPFEWLHLFYKWISESKDRTNIISTRPFLLDKDKKAVAAFNFKKQAILFLPSADASFSSSFNTVHRDLLKNPQTLDFFIKQLGLKEPSELDEIYKIIINEYDKGIFTNCYDHFKMFFHCYLKCSRYNTTTFIDKIKKYPFLFGYKINLGGQHIEQRARPEQLYFSDDKLMSWFAPTSNTLFIDLDKYIYLVGNNYKNDVYEFLQNLGVSATPRVRSLYSYEYFVDGLRELVNHIAKTKDADLSSQTWNQLLNLVDINNKNKDGTLKFLVYYDGKRKASKRDSADAICLKTKSWLLNTSNEFVPTPSLTPQTLHSRYNSSELRARELCAALDILQHDVSKFGDSLGLTEKEQIQALQEFANKRQAEKDKELRESLRLQFLETEKLDSAQESAKQEPSSRVPLQSDAPEKHNSSGQTNQTNSSGEVGQPSQTSSSEDTNKPDQTGLPKRASQPGQTSSANESSLSGQTSSSEDTNKPGQSGLPERASQPGQTNSSGEADKPGQTSSSKEASQPGQTSSSEDANGPGQTGLPKEASQPGQTSSSGDADQPGQTNSSAEASQPGQTSSSNESNLSGQTSSSEDTNKPGQTSLPKEASQPGQTSSSGDADQPDQTSSSGEVGQPDQIEKHDSADKKDSPEKPDSSEKLVSPEKPDSSEKLLSSEKPSSSGKPSAQSGAANELHQPNQHPKIAPEDDLGDIPPKRKKVVTDIAKRTPSTPKNQSVLDDAEDSDEYTKITFDANKKISKIEDCAASEIDQVLLIDELLTQAQENGRYSCGWFKALLKLEQMNAASDDNKDISISFEKVELEAGTKKTLVLKRPSHQIPLILEELTNLPLSLQLPDGKSIRLTVEVASVKSYTLRCKLNSSKNIDNLDLSLVKEARISSHNPNFLLDNLTNAFNSMVKENKYDDAYNMQENLCENIEFIFGPPGTGKTTRVAQGLISIMKKTRSYSVLVLTPTNKAADVLVRKIMESVDDDSYKNWLVRFGITNDDQIEQSGVLRDRTFDIRALSRKVVVTTMARYPYDYFYIAETEKRMHLKDMDWNYIFFDEASMIPIANIIYPLYKSTPNAFYIAGDPFQIGPIASVDLWKDMNIYTMIKLESFTQNPATVPHQYEVELLTTQYRSIPIIGDIFSKLAYDDVLEHNRSNDSRSLLPLSNFIDIKPLTIIKFPVSNYESIYKAKRLSHSSSYQIYLALFTFEFVRNLSKFFQNAERKFSIGIIAPYRAQADLVSKLVSSDSRQSNTDVQVGTIHGFQGDECDIIIAMYNPPPSISPSDKMFLNKLNIINVSISRARDYLIILKPDDNTKGVENLTLINKIERLCKEHPSWLAEYQAQDIEKKMLGSTTYFEDNSFSTGHQSVNVYGIPERLYEIRSEERAIDIQFYN